ncbi:MAG: META domain-containing protein [Anaerolineales bacterium]|nr:META domain-containing protein [Anaerolineales bacterium]
MKTNSTNYVCLLGFLAIWLMACTAPVQRNAIPDSPSLAEPVDPLLANTSWHLVEIYGKPFPSDLVATMTFAEDGVKGSILCNSWQSIGALTAANGRFSFPYIVATTVGCDQIELQKSFGEALTIHAKTYMLKDTFLVIQNDKEETILRFEQLKHVQSPTWNL